MSITSRTRKSGGQPSGGQFMGRRRKESDIGLEVRAIPEPVGFIARMTFPADLGIYATSSNAEMRKAAAVHPRSHSEVRALLAFDEDPEVRAAVASAPRTEPVLLALLANDFDAVVRGKVAKRPTTALLDLWRLLHDTDALTSQNAAVTLDDLGYESTPFDLKTALAAEARERAKATAAPRYGVRVASNAR